ncbi:MAG: EAL domain-containing protein [Thiothrix sp.]|nr:EAL domain-containing protein [Thiothrix sp.]HPQ95891.1 EAL domain-containing protein [Thiolinea sp.]
MNRQPIHCSIIRPSGSGLSRLEIRLRALDADIQVHPATSLTELKHQLSDSPALLFYLVSRPGHNQEQLLRLLQQHSPDTILVYASARRWSVLESRLSGIEVCTISTTDEDYLSQQLDFLIKYARLKRRFRQCKHLLSIAELRSQWLVDFSREAVAYVMGGRHLYANLAYLSLFGFERLEELLKTPVAELVREDDKTVFRSLVTSTENGARPSGRVRMTLVRRDRRGVRVEIRFIPSVYRGQRCLQLHVHPVPQRSKSREADNRKQRNPWREPLARRPAAAGPPPTPAARSPARPAAASVQNSSSAAGNAAMAVAPGTEVTTAAATRPARAATRRPSPRLQPRRTRMRNMALQPHFLETISTIGSRGPGVLLAEPFLLDQAGRRVPYRKLLAGAERNATRFQLDWWNIHKAVLEARRLQRTSRQPYLVVVEVGAWLFSQPARARELLALFNQQGRELESLALAISHEHFRRFQWIAEKLFPALGAAGIRLVINAVEARDAALGSFVDIGRPALARIAPALAGDVAREHLLRQPLQELVGWLDARGVPVLVSGVMDVQSMNLLSAIPVSYLEGEIMARLSR